MAEGDRDKFNVQEEGTGRHRGRDSYKGRAFHESRRDRQLGIHSRGFGGPGPRSDNRSKNIFDPYGRNFQKRGGRQRTGSGSCFRGERCAGEGGPTVRSGWYKVTIPHGSTYDKNWLMTALQNICSVSYTPVQYYVDHTRAFFYINDSTAANALRKCYHKITDKKGNKVKVYVDQCAPPSSLQLNPEDLEHLKQCMSKRYDSTHHTLDLNDILLDPDLVSRNVEVFLNRKTHLKSVIKIIGETVPELVCLNLSNNHIYKLDELSELVSKVPNLVKLNLSQNNLQTDQELDMVKGLKLSELWLIKNPLCDNFEDQEAYISAVRQRFPRLLKLDGHDLPPRIGFDIETLTTIPPCKGSFFPFEETKNYIVRFLQDYYHVYDCENRHLLFNAYHDEASMSLTTSSSNSEKYSKYSRNLMQIKDPMMRLQLLKYTPQNIVAFLQELPKTQHDLASFTVDVNIQTKTLLSFTVSGVFKEIVDGKSGGCTKAFSRVFITVPAEKSGMRIINDQLFIRNATEEELSCAFMAQVPNTSSRPVATLTALQHEMLTDFSKKSGMNLEWSLKCLQDNEWDYNQAASRFNLLKTEGKIPDVAFTQ